MAVDPTEESGSGSRDPGAGDATLMAVAADAAIDAALPGIVLIAVMAALALIGVAPQKRIESVGSVEDEVEAPHGDD
jgi:hypothetical protein